MDTAEDKGGDLGFERYTPNHPLPDEIRSMKRDDTVCRYCGVSYLIHNEIKALEKKLKGVELELEHYKGSELREQQLKDRVTSLEAKELELRQALTAKDSIILTLQADLKTSTDNNQNLCETKRDLEQRLTDSAKDKEMFKFKLGIIQNKLPSVVGELQKQKNCLQDLNNHIQKQRNDFKDEVQQIFTEVRKREKQSLAYLDQRISELEREKSDMEKSQRSQSEKSTEKINDLQKTCDELKNMLSKKTDQLEKSQSTLRMMSLELEQFRDNIKSKSQEIDNLNLQLRSNSQNQEQALQRLQLDLDQRKTELFELRKQYKEMENQLMEKQSVEREIQRKASLSINETQELRERYSRAQQDLDALKAERELMIEAHQNRITELKESFKNKMYEAEKWPEKLESALSKERQKHREDMEKLEEKLKENFVMEMQIEKQKHEELLQKYLAEFKEKETKLKNQIFDLENQLRSEGVDLRKQLQDARSYATETEGKLRKEIENLKAIIRDLEERLAKAGTGNEETTLELKEQLHQSHEDLLSAQQEMKHLQQQLGEKQQEVMFLQDTVRKECEERLELTESLSEAREQLLTLRRPPGGYSSASSNSNHVPNKPPSRLDSTGSERSTISQSSLNRTPTNQSGSSRPPANHLSGSVSQTNQNQGLYNQSPNQHESRNFIGSPDKVDRNKNLSPEVTSSNINMQFEKKSAKQGGKLKGKTIAENRKRIAALLGKR